MGTCSHKNRGTYIRKRSGHTQQTIDQGVRRCGGVVTADGAVETRFLAGQTVELADCEEKNIKKDEYTTVIAIFDRKSWGTLGNVGQQLGNSSQKASQQPHQPPHQPAQQKKPRTWAIVAIIQVHGINRRQEFANGARFTSLPLPRTVAVKPAGAIFAIFHRCTSPGN